MTFTTIERRYDRRGNLLSRTVGERKEVAVSDEEYLNAMSVVLTGMSADRLAEEITAKKRAKTRKNAG